MLKLTTIAKPSVAVQLIEYGTYNPWLSYTCTIAIVPY